MKRKIISFCVMLFCAMSIIKAQFNTPTGTNALISITTGQANTATGFETMYYTSSGWNNSAHGLQAMYFNNTGGNNSAYGSCSMFYNNSGNENTALGFKSLMSNTAGIRNTAAGAFALYYTDNTGLNTGMGYMALHNNVSGNFCTAIGAYTGQQNTASYNTYIGAYADANATGYVNSTAIGYNATVTNSNEIRFGDNNIISIGGSAGWYTFSDRRVKRNIQENVPGLSFVGLLKPVTYHMDVTAADDIINRPDRRDASGKLIPLSPEREAARIAKENILYTGFIAQDVESAAKSINYEFSGVEAAKNEHSLYGLRYAEFVVPLVKAAQELNAFQEGLKTEVADLKKKINAALQEIADIQAQKKSVNPAGYLEQNAPNPYSSSTLIRYHLTETAANGQILISTLDGKLVKMYPVSGRGSGQVRVDRAELASGTYSYSLIVKGQKVDTKRMIITK